MLINTARECGSCCFRKLPEKMAQFWIFILFVGLYHGVGRATQCTARARYPNDLLSECRGYSTCIPGPNQTFYQYDLQCPQSFLYNHLDNQCTNATNYKCYQDYNCTELGTFVNLDNSNCTSYISCIKGLSDIVTARFIECVDDTVFSPIEETCVEKSQYECHQIMNPFQTTTVSDSIMDLTEKSYESNTAIRVFRHNVFLYLALFLIVACT